MHGSLEDIEHGTVRTGSDKGITFLSGVSACALTSSVLTALPLAMADTAAGQAVGSLAFAHALPLSVILVGLMTACPHYRTSGLFASAAGALGAATACVIVLAYVALGALSSVLVNPHDALLLLSPVIGGYFGGMAAARIMQEPYLPAIVRKDVFDPEEDRVIVNPQSWADRTEGWTSDPRC